MTVRAPFQPNYGTNQTVTTAAGIASISIDPWAKSVRIVNAGNVDQAYVRIASGSITTMPTANSFYIPIGGTVVVQKSMGENTFAYRSPSGTTTLHIMTGEGG